MKGLIYKEWCLCKKAMAIFVIIVVLFAIMGVLFALSMKIGNLRNYMQNVPEEAKLLLGVFIYIPYLLSLATMELSVDNIQKDFKTGWMNFAYTLPDGVRKAVGSKYIFSGITMILAFVFTIINSAILCSVSSLKFTGNIIKNMMLILLIVTVLMAVKIPLLYKFKGSQSVTNIGIGVLLFLCFYMEYKVSVKENVEESMEILLKQVFELRDSICWYVPLLVIVMMFISYVVTVKIYDRRDK